MAVKSVTERFIERMGFAAEEDRLPRIAGRIFGLLLLEVEPLSLDQVASRLRVSRASVSTNARVLHSLGIIERVMQPNDRRDYFQVSEDPGRELLRSTAKMMTDRSRMLGETRHAFGDRPAVRDRLMNLEEFYRAVGRGIERALADLNK